MDRKSVPPRPSGAAIEPAKRRAPTPTAGQRLVAELSKDGDPYSVTVLIVQAGRIADHLDKLHALLSGEKSAWMHVRVNRDQVLEVRVDNALGESRQQTTVLRHLLAEIHRQRAGIPMACDDDDDLAGL